MSQAADDVHRKVQELVQHTQRTNALRSDVTAVDIHHLLELFSRSPMSMGDAAAEPAPVAAVILGHERLLTSPWTVSEATQPQVRSPRRPIGIPTASVG